MSTKKLITTLFITITIILLISTVSATNTTDTTNATTITKELTTNTQNNIQNNENEYILDNKDNKTKIINEEKGNIKQNNSVDTKTTKNEKTIKKLWPAGDITLDVTPTNNLKVGDTVKISNTMNNFMATKDLELYVNNKYSTNFQRNSQIDYTLTNAGTNTLYVSYPGDDYVDPGQSNTVTITVSENSNQNITKTTSSITLTSNATKVKINESFDIYTTVTPNDATGDIEIFLNGQSLGSYTLSKNGARMALPQKGTFTIYATYSGDKNYYNSTSNIVTVEVVGDEDVVVNGTDVINDTDGTNGTGSKLDCVILAEDMYMRVGSSIIMNFTLVDVNGRPISGQELYLSLDGDTQGPAITEVDGSVHLNFSNYGDGYGMQQGEYPLTISFGGSDSYNPVSKTVILTIAVRTWETTTVIEANVSRVDYGGSFTITPTVEPGFMLHPIDNSSYVEVVVLSVYKDGKYYAEYSAHPREYWIFDGFLPGVYAFNATYKGSDVLFPSSSGVVTVTVVGDSPVDGSASISLSASETRVDVGETVTLFSPVVPSDATGIISLYCNGALLYEYSTGQGGGFVTLSEPGNFTFYAVYEGNGIYDSATSNTVTIEVVGDEEETTLELETYVGLEKIPVGEKFGVLITPNPKEYEGIIYVSYIDPEGKTHTTSFNYPGTDGVKLSLNKTGNYTFYSYVSNDSIYGTVYSNNVSVEIFDNTPYELSIELIPDQSKFGRTTTVITRQNINTAKGTITYVIDDEDFVTYEASELIKNAPTFAFYKAGNITIQARYDGDDYGTVFSEKLIFEYLPLESVIEAEDLTVNKGEIAEFVIRLIDEDGYVIRLDENDIPVGNQTIYFIIDNIKYGPFKTNSEGIATFAFNTSSLKIDEYPVSIIYEGGVWDNLTIYDVEDSLYQDYAHYPLNKTILLNVIGKKNVTIDANNINMNVYDNVSLSIKVNDDDGIINPSITVKINNKEYSISINDNIANVDLSTLEQGKYNAIITYNPDSTHTKANKTVQITVNKKQPKISINNIANNNVGDKINITGKLVDEDGKTISNAIITLNINNNGISDKFNTTTDKNGKYAYEYVIRRNGTYTVCVESSENNTHMIAKNQTTFISTKKATEITIKTDKTTYNVGDKIIITPTVTPNNITDNIILTINNQNVTVKANQEYTITTTKSTKYTFIGIYQGNDIYLNSTSNTINVNVNKINPKISVQSINKTPINTVVIITGVLTDGSKVISNANIDVKVNDEKLSAKTNAKGIYAVNYTTTKIGSNNVIVNYSGNNKYNGVTNKTSFIVYNNSVSLTLKTDKNKYVVGETITISPMVSPKDATGKVTLNINGLNIQVDVNKDYKYVANNERVINITAKYNGDKTYKESDVKTAKVNIIKLATTISIEKINNTKMGSIITVKGKLTDINNKTINKEKIIIIVNNNQTLNVTTDNNGNYKTNINVDKLNENNINVIYNGNDKYIASKNNTTFNSSKYSTKIVINRIVGIIGENITLKANITDLDGNPVSGGYVIYKLNGLTLKNDGVFGSNSTQLKVNVINGSAEYTLEAYLYLRRAQNVTAVYSGSSKYESSRSAAKSAQILLRNASVTVSTVQMAKQNSNITLTAKVYDVTNDNKVLLKRLDEGYVYFKVNGRTIRGEDNDSLKVKVVNGVAKTTYNIPNGMGGITSQDHSVYKNYTVLAGYANPDYYPSAYNTTVFNIERANISFNVDSITFNNKTKQLNIKSNILTDSNINVLGTNTMIVKINGGTYKNSSTNKPIYYNIQDGVVNLTLELSKNVKSIDYIELVTGERLVYNSARLNTTNITVIN